MTGNAKKPSSAEQSYVRKMMRRARELQESSAFAPAPAGVGNDITLEGAKAQLKRDRVKNRVAIVVSVIAMLLIALVSLCIPFYTTDFQGDASVIYSPAQVLSCYKLFIQLHVVPLFDASATLQAASLKASFSDMSMYDGLTRRFGVTILVVVCGFLLAVSGLLFQSSFKNPLAAPTMLGVSDGVTLGSIIFIYLGYSFVNEAPGLYVLCLYGGGVVVLVAVMLLSRFVGGGKKASIFDMLLIGTVICQLLAGVSNYIINFAMDVDTWERFYELQQAVDVIAEPATYIVVAIVCVLTIVPTFLLRFRFNLVSYSNAEIRMLGAHPRLLRGAALVLGSLMQLAAIASIGQVAMLSMAVPFLVRYMFRNEFRSQMLGNFLIGAIVLLICEVLQNFLVVHTVLGMATMPLGAIVSLVIIPFFVWMMSLQKRGWE